MYMRPHFRGCYEWREENLNMTSTSDSAVKLYDSAIQQLMLHKSDTALGGLEGTINAMLEADPDFTMGKVVAAGLVSLESNTFVNDKLTVQLEDLMKLIENGNLNERERIHCEAVVANLNGNRFKACNKWEEILSLYPRDTLALKLSYLNYIYLGCSAMLRDVLARVLPHWKRSDPEYGYLLNMYAFGLEETNLYAAAEANVLDGLSLAPGDSWGVHTAAHIYESTCRHDKSGDILLKTESIWSDNNALSCHNYWHLSNYYTEKNSFDKVLEIYDQHIEPLYKNHSSSFQLNDASQLLQKLEFEGVDVGERWEDLYESYVANIPDHFLCYDDLFKINSFCKSKRAQEMNKKKTFMESVKNYVESIVDDNTQLTHDIGLSMMKGLIAYNDGCHDDAVDYLYPHKQKFIRLGGSHAQRDIFDLFLINACIHSKSVNKRKLGRVLLYERKALKSESMLSDRLMAKLLASHVD